MTTHAGENRFQMIRAAAIAALVGGSMMLGTAVHAAKSADGTANATVVQEIAITAGDTLEFGKFSVGTSGGTLVVSAAGAVSATGDVKPLVTGSTARAATFTVTGESGASYALTLPGSVTLNSGANSMTLGSFTSSLGGSSGSLTGGTQTVDVGATLTVGANQAAGAYAGTFAVSVEYN